MHREGEPNAALAVTRDASAVLGVTRCGDRVGERTCELARRFAAGEPPLSLCASMALALTEDPPCSAIDMVCLQAAKVEGKRFKHLHSLSRESIRAALP